MTAWEVRYSVGNEHNPSDPWGRSELTLRADRTAWLDHFFSRGPGIGTWTGRVDPAALDALWAGLDRAGFPAEPSGPLVAGATLRRLTTVVDGVTRQASVEWRKAASLPGYAEAFDILDGVIRQLSGEAVPYPSTQPPIVSSIEALGA